MSFSKGYKNYIIENMVYSNKIGETIEDIKLDKSFEQYSEDMAYYMNDDLTIDRKNPKSTNVWFWFNGVDFTGLHWHREKVEPNFNMDENTVKFIIGFFKMLRELNPKSFDKSVLMRPKSMWGSYGLKHTMEKLHKVMLPEQTRHYVSNGEFILGYWIFMSEYMGFTQNNMRRLIKPQYGFCDMPGLNAYIAMPSTFNLLDTYVMERRIF